VLLQNHCLSTFYECVLIKFQFVLTNHLIAIHWSLFLRYPGSTSSACDGGTLRVTYWPNSQNCAGAGLNDSIPSNLCMVSSDTISYVRIVC
jgi:hypothetical protein